MMSDYTGLKVSTALRAEVVDSEAAFDLLAGEWNGLLEDSDQRVYFLRWQWNRLWWRYFQPPGSRLYIIVCRDEVGRLVGLAPFYWRQRRLFGLPHIREVHFLGTGIYTQTSEYLDIIARRGCEQVVAEEVANFLVRSDDWDRLWLTEIPAHSTVLPHFRRALGEQKKEIFIAGRERLQEERNLYVEICNRSNYLDAQTEWDTFLAGLSKSTQKNLSYHTRRLSKLYECRFRMVESAEELERAQAELVRLHQARWQARGEPGSFAIPGMEEFLKEACRSSLAEGRLRMCTLELDTRVAAVLLLFFDNGTVHGFQGGFDPAYAKYSIGTVIHGMCLRACIEDEEVREYDFMGGGDAYKSSWAGKSRDSLCLTWLRPGLRSLAYRGTEKAIRAGKSLARATIPATVRAALRRHFERRHYSPQPSALSRQPSVFSRQGKYSTT
ncbi:MAG: GNAT family N-acetyltransferase, partial [Blastocatellia bacterium]|nr:GNAT family N-acetyltransferase [Blastocatellia bacterium]